MNALSAVVNLGSFAADQASTIEVAIIVKDIKGEVCFPFHWTILVN